MKSSKKKSQVSQRKTFLYIKEEEGGGGSFTHPHSKCRHQLQAGKGNYIFLRPKARPYCLAPYKAFGSPLAVAEQEGPVHYFLMMGHLTLIGGDLFARPFDLKLSDIICCCLIILIIFIIVIKYSCMWSITGANSCAYNIHCLMKRQTYKYNNIFKKYSY